MPKEKRVVLMTGDGKKYLEEKKAELESQLKDLKAQRREMASQETKISGNAGLQGIDASIQRRANRIREIQDKLDNAEIVDIDQGDEDCITVTVGSRVKVVVCSHDLPPQEVEIYLDGDPSIPRPEGTVAVAIDSPIGGAINGAKPGEEVEYCLEDGRPRRVVIVAIS